MKQPLFTGVATAIVTPFLKHRIDFASFDRILDTQLDAGIDAIVVCGTTGEASTLTTEEKIDIWSHAASYLNGRAKLIAGTGTNNTAISVQLSKLAADCGADGLLAVTPYYNKCSQDGLIKHYTTIADATHLPLITYNVPSRTGVDLLPETCKKLSGHPNIIGIKEAGSSIVRISQLRRLCGDEFYIWSGNDDQLVAAMSLGACGVISVLSNICPAGVKAIASACLNNDPSAASSLQIQYLPLIEALFSDVNPIPVKKALEILGQCSGELRLPLSEISDIKSENLSGILREYPEFQKKLS